MLETEHTAFLLTDVQGRLAELMHDQIALFDHLRRAIRGMQLLGIPIIWMEQNPEKLGETTPVIRELMEAEERPIAKMCFSCCAEPAFMARLDALGRRQILVAGIETHICIYQTVTDLVRHGYEVEVLGDAVSSRTAGNKQVGLDKIKAAGAHVTSVETALFELMKTAAHPAFREMLKIVK